VTIKTILVPLTGETTGKDAALCALKLAGQIGAHVTVGYEDGLGPTYVAPDFGGLAFSYRVFYEELQKARAERKALARTYFDQAIAATNIAIVSAPACQHGSAMWLDQKTTDGATLAALGGLSDLVVLGAPGSRLSPTSWMVEETLFTLRRTALIVPPGTTTVDFSRPLLAWNGSPEAANALRQAMVLFPADARVTVLHIGDTKTGRIPAVSAAEYLKWHCFKAEIAWLGDRPQATAQIILEEAGRSAATCLVLGAYSHSRARELLLGGVTDSMLRAPKLPMIMAH
jgi:nucleotide-binding universal stress UspA family protein